MEEFQFEQADETDSNRRRQIEQAAECLLQVPFSKALSLSGKLREHIRCQDDPDSVEDEFLAAWEPDAPDLLWQVLLQVLEAEDDSAIFAMIAFSPLADQHNIGEADVRRLLRSPQADSVFDPSALAASNRVRKLQRFMDSPERGTIEWGGWLPGEMAAPPAETVDDLLAMPYGDALALSKQLRSYLDDVEDREAVETEIRRAWGPDAPQDLRAMLERALSEYDLSLVEEGADESGEDDMLTIGSMDAGKFMNMQGALLAETKINSKL